MITVYTFHSNPLHMKCLTAFIRGLQKHKVKHQVFPIGKGYVKSDHIVLFGHYKNNGHGNKRKEIIKAHGDPSTTVIIERGFVKRDQYHMVGLGGLNGRADFKNQNSPDDRWSALNVKFKKVDWEANTKIVICGQVPSDASVMNINYQDWVNKCYTILSNSTELEILFKPHPQTPGAIKIPQGCGKVSEKALTDILPSCRATVAYNSNSGVESLLGGVPTLAVDVGSMAWGMSNVHNVANIRNLQMPSDQELLQWAFNLAYTQWNIQEMEAGLPHKHLSLI